MSEDYAESVRELEEAIRKAHEGFYELRLYVSGSSPRSTKAISNVRNICEEYLAGRYNLEVVDLFQQPELASDAQVLAAPTLVKETPAPVRRLVGDMSDQDKVLYSLHLARNEA